MNLPDLDATRFAVLACLVFLAGFVDAMAGGGGLITLPAYLAVGLPPSLVLGTNKLGSTIGTAAATARFWAKLDMSARVLLPAVLATMAGSFLGARLALLLDPAWIRRLLLGALPLAAFAVLSRRGFGGDDSGSVMPAGRLSSRAMAVVFPIGAYDGFFGPGTGTFLALGLSRFCRLSLLRATAWAKVINLVSNAAALAAFLAGSAVHVRLGLAMGVFSVAGNYVGATVGIKRSALIRPVIALVCAGLFLNILFGL
ncbi:MAG: TSUP family transporter [Elusimicrobiota bacterium]